MVYKIIYNSTYSTNIDIRINHPLCCICNRCRLVLKNTNYPVLNISLNTKNLDPSMRYNQRHFKFSECRVFSV